MVFYRKYRPQRVEELDLDAVRKRLTSILTQKEIPHAFLFTGPKGLGKTSTARILAKAVNCQGKKDKDIEPCNTCEACKTITNGSNLDVLEIDAASNRGIDEIRELRERIKFSPAVLSKKVYIIDEVHMLTTDAFNALLKTLEEPPGHAVFILCTTELEKVPSTITSRTFHITFHKPSREEALRSLKRVVDGEKLDIEDDVLEEILVFAEDSFRDATKILQELSISSGGKKITKDILDKTYNSQNIDASSRSIIKSLADKDVKNTLNAIKVLAEVGADFKVVTEKLANILHSAILAKNGLGKESDELKSFSIEELNNLLNKINKSYKDIKTSILPQLPLEIVVIEWCQNKKESLKTKDETDSKEEVMEPKDKASENEPYLSKTDAKNEAEELPGKEVKEDGDEKEGVGMFSKNVLPDNFFQSLIERVKQDNHSIAGILRGCKLAELSEDKAFFEAKYKFHRDKLNESETIKILDKRASELLNRQIKVVVEMVAK